LAIEAPRERGKIRDTFATPEGFGQPSSTQISATVAKLQQTAAFSPPLRHKTLTHQDL
jgi:hypothetical protein